MLPKMVLFDFGQTLFELKDFSALEGYESVMRQMTENPQNISVEAFTAFTSKYLKQCGNIFGYKEKRYWHLEIPQAKILNYAMEYYGLKSNCSLEELSEIYWNHVYNATPVQDTERMLDCLNQHGIRTGIVSNSSFSGEVLKRHMDRHLPNHHMEFVISSTDIMFRKPEPAIFELAIAKSGCRPEEIWYCGDDSIWDVEGSYAVGMTPVWFRGAIDCEQPIPTVDHIGVQDWTEFVEIITRLVANERSVR